MEDRGQKTVTTQQMRVANHFAATLRRWEDIYTRQGVFAAIYRQRCDLALSLLHTLQLPVGSRVLDVGCGPGIASVALATQGYIVYAIDNVIGMADRTQQRAIDAHLEGRILPVVGDIHRLCFRNSLFDAALVLGVTEWLEDLEAPLKEISRILQSGGHVVIAADNKWALDRIVDPLRNPLSRPIVDLLRKCAVHIGIAEAKPQQYCYSTKAFDLMLRNAGLRKVKSVSLGFGPISFCRQPLLPTSWGLAFHRALQRLADRGFPIVRSAGHVYVVIARR